MGFWGDIFGSGGGIPAVTVYAETVNGLPGSAFPREVTLMAGGARRTLTGMALRDHLATLCQNGITLTRLDERLKRDGVEGDQIERRREIIATLRQVAGGKDEVRSQK